MKTFIIRELLHPVITRLGSGVAGYLVGTWAVSPEQSSAIAVGLTTLVMVMLDLSMRKALEK